MSIVFQESYFVNTCHSANDFQIKIKNRTKNDKRVQRIKIKIKTRILKKKKRLSPTKRKKSQKRIILKVLQV